MRRVHGGEAAASARQVAAALAGWRQRGEAAADLAFWRGQLDHFRSPKAFALVVDALLRKGDFRAALALLASWVGQAEQVPLEDGAYSFHAPGPALDAGADAAGRRGGRRRPAVRRRNAAPWSSNSSTTWRRTRRNTGRSLTLDVVEAGGARTRRKRRPLRGGLRGRDLPGQHRRRRGRGLGRRRAAGGVRPGARGRAAGPSAALPDDAGPALAGGGAVPGRRRTVPAGGGRQSPAAAWLRAARDKRRRMLRCSTPFTPSRCRTPAAPTIRWWSTTAAASSRSSCSTRPSAPASHLTLAVGALQGAVGGDDAGQDADGAVAAVGAGRAAPGKGAVPRRAGRRPGRRCRRSWKASGRSRCCSRR